MPHPSAPDLTATDSAQGRVLALRGHWSAAGLAQAGAWSRVRRALTQPASAQSPQSDTGWDLQAVERLDHVGAQLLWNHWGRAWPERLVLAPGQRAMLERVAAFTVAPPPVPRVRWAAVRALGEQVFAGLAHGRDFLALIGQTLFDLMHLVCAPRRAPWRDLSGHLFHVGATALPITALVGFLIGVVFAYLTAQQLRLFGANAYIVDILGLSLIRELGPILAAILIAGRSGSAITAQIGVMRVTEELDAMRVLGIPLGFRLVLPRVLALALVMPLISVWTTLAALAGGMLSADLVLNITPAFFFEALPKAVAVSNLYLALAKSAVFGALIALTGCHYGLRVKPNTESLGQGTTSAVVTAITIVILVDAVFAVACKDIGV